MKILPESPTPNEQALAQMYWEQFTGLTTTAVTLTYSVATTQDDKALVLLYKNGLLLSQGAGAGNYTITGTAITLGTAAIAGDNFHTFYWYRS